MVAAFLWHVCYHGWLLFDLTPHSFNPLNSMTVWCNYSMDGLEYTWSIKYYCLQFYQYYSYLQSYSRFATLDLLLLYMYFNLSSMTAMCTDPGSVPKDARPLVSDIEERDYEANETTRDRYRKFCRRCNAFKPQRAHHCSICGRCIVKMDHHCP